MQIRRSKQLLLAAAVVGVGLMGSPAMALDWDIDQTTAGAQGGAATWLNDGLTTNWWDATSSTNVVWTNGADAKFATPAGIVTIGDNTIEAGTVTFATSGYTLGVSGNTADLLTLTNLTTNVNSTVNVRLLNTTGTLTLNVTGGTTSISGGIGDGATNAFAVEKTGNGTVTLTTNAGTFTNGTTVSAGTLNANVVGALGTGNVTVKSGGFLGIGANGVTSGAITVESGGRADVTTASNASNNITVAAGGLVGGNNTNLASLTRGTNITLDAGASVVHTTAGNVSSIANLGTASDLYFALGTTFNSGATNLAVGTGTAWKGVSTDRSARSFQQGTITANSDFELRGINGQTLTLGNGTSGGNIKIDTAGVARTATIGGTVVLDESTATNDHFSNVKFYAPAGGTLQLNNVASLGGGSIELAGGQLNLRNSASVTYAADVTVSESSTISVDKSSGSNNTLTVGTIYIGEKTLNVIGGSGYSLNASALELSGTATFNPTSATFRVDGVISASDSAYGINKIGTGAMTFRGSTDNTYTGLTTVTAGTLFLDKTAAIAIKGDILINGGTLTLNQADQIANDSDVTLATGNFNTLANADTIGTLTQSGGTLTVAAGGSLSAGTLTRSSGASVISGSLNATALGLSGGTSTVNAGGSITTSGLTLTHSGGTLATLNADAANPGKLVLAGNLTLVDGAAATTATTLATGTVGGGQTAGQIDLDGAVRTFSIADTAAANDLSIGAAIVNGGIVKTGAGRLHLTGNSSFGSLSIDEGNVQANNANSLGTGTVTLNGGTLELRKSASLAFNASVVVAQDGTISLDRDGSSGSAGRLDVANLTINDGRTLTTTAAYSATFGVTGTTTLLGNTTLAVASTATLNQVAMTGGTFELTGASKVILAADNTGTITGGTVKVTSGSLDLNASGALGAASLVFNGGTVNVNASGTISAAPLNITTGGVNFAAAVGTVPNDLTIASGATGGATGVTMTGVVVNNGTFTKGNGTSSKVEFTNGFSGTGTLVSNDSGTALTPASYEDLVNRSFLFTKNAAVHDMRISSDSVNFLGLAVRGSGVTVNYTGTLRGDSGSNANTGIFVDQGAKLVFAADAVIDSVRDTAGNGRNVRIYGDGTGTIEFANGFKADLNGDGAADAQNWSNVRLSGVTIITHNTGVFGGFMLMDIANGTSGQTVWNTRTAAQTFNSTFSLSKNSGTNMTFKTDTSLTLANTFTIEKDTTGLRTSSTVTKDGRQSLIFGNAVAIATDVADASTGIRTYAANIDVVSGGLVFATGSTVTAIDNSLASDVTPGTASQIAADWNNVNALVAGGAITSSRLADGDKVLLVLDGADLGGMTVAGHASTATDILVRVTFNADANLDGKVDVGDLGILASNWNAAGLTAAKNASWIKADFDGNGSVDVGDLGALASNWNKGSGSGALSFSEAISLFPALTGVEVPEPASLGLLAIGAMALLRRRK